MDSNNVGYFEEAPGKKSMGRVVILIASVLGGVLILSGVVLGFFEAFLNLPHVGNAVVFSTIGAGLFTGGLLTKGWQKTSEAKMYTPNTQGVSDEPAEQSTGR